MGNVPVYWKTSVEDVNELIKTIKRGKVVGTVNSAGNRPVQLLLYGKKIT